jgi:hypothetical protein
MTPDGGDPGKLAYFKNPNWTPAPREDMRTANLDPRGCFGCCFGTPHDSVKWPHTFKAGCKLALDPFKNTLADYMEHRQRGIQ